MLRPPAAAPSGDDDAPAHRYTAALAQEIELRWQERWDVEGTFEAPNPAGPLADPEGVAERGRKLFVLDMFPYPSGTGLHVGHPLGFTGTDVYSRYQRMAGRNVLYSMGFDAFGLPAEQFAVQTGTHPAVTTAQNVADVPRADPPARPEPRPAPLDRHHRSGVLPLDAVDLPADLRVVVRSRAGQPGGDAWAAPARSASCAPSSTPAPASWTTVASGGSCRPRSGPRRSTGYRLAYVSDAPVNWCPGLGTVVANEEVTADGRSDRGNFPVFKRNMRQWMMRITAYADRLIDDLDVFEWTESLKTIQRNWIGRSHGARIDFDSPAGPITVFTTRPDTLFGATFMVLAPEHPLVPALTGGDEAEAVLAYKRQAEARKDVDRQDENRVKTGVFTGSYATNPVTGQDIPIWIADYVLMGYGTGAIMAVPCGDQPRLRVRPRLRARHPRHPAAARRVVRGARHRADAGHRPLAGGVRRRRAIRQLGEQGRRPERHDVRRRRHRGHQRVAGGPRASARRRSPTSCATGCSAASATGASRSRSSTTSTATRTPCPTTSCR